MGPAAVIGRAKILQVDFENSLALLWQKCIFEIPKSRLS